MDADEFVRSISRCATNVDDLISDGFSEEFARDTCATYHCWLKDTTIGRTSEDPLIDLIKRYNTSELEIGVITFCDEIKQCSRGQLVAKAEADFLSIRDVDGKIEMLDHMNLSHVMCSCARDSAMFLSAIARFADGLAKMYLLGEKSSGLSSVWLNEMIELAGGDEYKSFYMMLSGVYDDA